jgi:hypothetical protein
MPQIIMIFQPHLVWAKTQHGPHEMAGAAEVIRDGHQAIDHVRIFRIAGG